MIEGVPSDCIPVAYRQVRYKEFYIHEGCAIRWLNPYDSASENLIVTVKPKRVLVVPEFELPEGVTDSDIHVSFWDKSTGLFVTIPHSIEERNS